MASRRFASRFAGHLALLFALVAGFAWLLPQPGFQATKLLLAVGAIGAGVALCLHVQRTNATLARFVSAVVHRDFAQAFREDRQGSGFDALGKALNQAIAALRDDRAQRLDENRFAAALADAAPTPLLAISPSGALELANAAARRQFPAAGGTIDSLAPYGAALVATVREARPGTRQLCRIALDGLPQRATVSAAEVERLGRPWRIVAVQVIQRELDTAELAVQTDLVRVLTHEIMNSMTPVTSLAETAAATMATLDPSDAPALADARAAVETLARRAAGIMHFVDTYRTFTRAPTLRASRFAVAPWADELARLFAATPAAHGVRFERATVPAELRLDGDANLLAQVALNLLKNAAEAARGHGDAPRVALSIAPLPSGRLRIAVTDNGPGIPPERRDEVFLPFYTTKRKGTGVGLSVARQIVLLHGGAIGVAENSDGGTTVEIIL